MKKSKLARVQVAPAPTGNAPVLFSEHNVGLDIESFQYGAGLELRKYESSKGRRSDSPQHEMPQEVVIPFEFTEHDDDGVRFAVAVATDLSELDPDPDFLMFKDILRWSGNNADFNAIKDDFFSMLRRQPSYNERKMLTVCLLDLGLVTFAWLAVLLYWTTGLMHDKKTTKDDKSNKFHSPWDSPDAFHAHVGNLIMMAASVLRFPSPMIRALSDGYADETSSHKHMKQMPWWTRYFLRAIIFVLLAVIFAGPVGALVLWSKTDAMKTDPNKDTLNVTGLEIVGPIVLAAIVCVALTYDAIVSGDEKLRKYQAGLTHKKMKKTVTVETDEGRELKPETVLLQDAVHSLYRRVKKDDPGEGCCRCSCWRMFKSACFQCSKLPFVPSKFGTVFAILCPVPVVVYPGLTRMIWYHDSFLPNQLAEPSYRACLLLGLFTTYFALAVLFFLMADTHTFLKERHRATKALFDAVIPPDLPAEHPKSDGGRQGSRNGRNSNNGQDSTDAEQLRLDFGFANNMDAWSRLFIFVQSHKHKELKRAESVVSCIIAIIAILGGVLIYYRSTGQLIDSHNMSLGAWTISSVSLYATLVLGGFLLFPTLYLGVHINDCITRFGEFTVPMIKWRIKTVETIWNNDHAGAELESEDPAATVDDPSAAERKQSPPIPPIRSCEDSGGLFDMLDSINALVSSPAYIFRILYVPLNSTSLKALMALIGTTAATTLWNMISAGSSAA
eukprot:GILK01011647.1.p1 GENE.GILK01011647.1~~GILK01011647.1.p1  ORF type:complete len:728 (-),score=88.16 GILK01011647.1:310-2493(-)